MSQNRRFSVEHPQWHYMTLGYRKPRYVSPVGDGLWQQSPLAYQNSRIIYYTANCLKSSCLPAPAHLDTNIIHTIQVAKQSHIPAVTLTLQHSGHR